MIDAITMTARGLVAGDHPRIPFIEGDGTGPDIWRAARTVLDAAVQTSTSALGEREARNLG